MAELLADVLKNKNRPLVSIENNSEQTASVNSIELPEQIEKLITGDDFWRLAKANRYKKLIREGYIRELLELAEMAVTKDKPACWFAKYASKATWERTLQFLAEARAVAQAAAEVAKRLMCSPEQMKAVYKACWRFRGVVVKHAITAAEIGRDRFKFFCWLCWGQPARNGSFTPVNGVR